MHHPTDRSLLLVTHWAISQPSQRSTTGITNGVVCAILSVWVVHIKYPLLLIGKCGACSGGSGFHLSLSGGPLPYVGCHITVNNMLRASLNKTFPSFLAKDVPGTRSVWARGNVSSVCVYCRTPRGSWFAGCTCTPSTGYTCLPRHPAENRKSAKCSRLVTVLVSVLLIF